MIPSLQNVLEALRIGTGFLWTAGWAIIMGLIITSWVQVYVSKERVARLLGEPDVPGLLKATGFGAASSGCSFGAAAIAKGLFRQGAHAVNTLAFMFASTNLIVELGLMILILFGWKFLAAEILGGLVLIVIMAALARLTLPDELFEKARQRLRERESAGETDDPVCGMEGSDEYTLEVDGRTVRFCSEGCRETFEQQRAGRGGRRDLLTSRGGWFRLANRYRKEWSMIWKDVLAGFLISGFVIVFVPQSVWNALFLEGGSVWAAAENAFMGVAVAVISFVGSIGNVPFAVALWTGGVSFAGVIAFIYSDLITIPVLNVYRKYYGWKVTLYIFLIFFVTMATSGFLMEQLFGLLNIIPEVVPGASATARDYFSLDYTFWLNLVALGLSGALYWVYRRGLNAGGGGARRDAVCGMGVDENAPKMEMDGKVYRFCSEGCRRKFQYSPERYLATNRPPTGA